MGWRDSHFVKDKFDRGYDYNVTLTDFLGRERVWILRHAERPIWMQRTPQNMRRANRRASASRQATPSEKFIGGEPRWHPSIYAFLPQRGRPEVVASKCSKLKRQTIPPSDKARSCAKVLCKRTGTLENVGLRVGVQRGRIPASGYRPSMAKSNCVATWWRHSTQFASEAALKCK
jgi:hypothetical protein